MSIHRCGSADQGTLKVYVSPSTYPLGTLKVKACVNLQEVLQAHRMWDDEDLKRVSYTSWEKDGFSMTQFSRRWVGLDNVPLIDTLVFVFKKLSIPDMCALVYIKGRHNNVTSGKENLQNQRDTQQHIPAPVHVKIEEVELDSEPKTPPSPTTPKKHCGWFSNFFESLSSVFHSFWRRLLTLLQHCRPSPPQQ